MMFVRTQFSLCVRGCTKESGIHRSRSKENAIVIEEECLPFPTEKRYSPLMCRKKERIVGYVVEKS